MDWTNLPPYVIAIVAFLGWLMSWVKGRRESELSYAAEVRGLRADRAEWLRREREYELQMRAQNLEVEKLREEVEHLSRVVPMALIGSRALEANGPTSDLLWLLEKSGQLWWSTSPLDRGYVVWSTTAWSQLLRCGAEDLRGTGWRKFLHPKSVQPTSEAEAEAWRGRVEDFANCFVGSDGVEHELRWNALEYQRGGRGVTLALAIEEGGSR